jgi:hypothetical protein
MSLNYVEITATAASAALARLIFSRISRPEARQTHFFGFRLRSTQIGFDGTDQLAQRLKAAFSNDFGGQFPEDCWPILHISQNFHFIRQL